LSVFVVVVMFLFTSRDLEMCIYVVTLFVF